MNISKWALNRGVLIHAFVAVLIIGGLWAFTQMPKLEDPAIRAVSYTHLTLPTSLSV